MNKIIPLSLVAILSLSATEIELAPIGVESTVITEVAQNAQISADLAEALSSRVPSIDMNRRSGIANDILIRGQKRDNISVEVDGTKVHGACVNRMDPPTSHILASQIDEIEVIEGPFDVETFGTMSGGVKIKTKKPTKDFSGEITGGVGSWGYKKLGATVSGGNDTVRVLVSASTESSGQYEDGDGNTISQQIDNAVAAGIVPAANAIHPDYKNMDAYDKKSIMAKAFVNVTNDQELRLSYTGNRSDNIIYGNTQMDAVYDDSNIYSIEYNIHNLTELYKDLNLQYYYSDVDHPMSTQFRANEATNYKTNKLKTSMQGIKIKNNFDMDNYKLVFGLDGSKRTWDGTSYTTNVATGAVSAVAVSLTPTETTNHAAFAKLTKQVGKLNVKIGARYDITNIQPEDASNISRDYNALNANMVTTYNITKDDKVFLGFGQAYRVPDARELYLTAPTPGNQNLEQTRNREIDLGYESASDTFNFKIKAFYSKLSDYIYYKRTSGMNASAQNIDAKVYGTEVSGEFFATDNVTVDASIAYKRGKKDQVITGQTDKDLADMAPLRATLGATYEYANNSNISAEIQASDKWDTIDSDNGEQNISGWAILNLKAKHAFGKTIDLTVGVNNVFDATYAISNTYSDLVLLSTGTSTEMLMNDPGRYLYTNLTYKF